MVKITVFGSCVCRDLFEKDYGLNFEFYTDVRFQSPISVLSKPTSNIHARQEDFTKKVKVAGSKWYIKNLINDINKTTFLELKRNHGDFLVMDLAEARLPLSLIEWEGSTDNLLITNSVTFRSNYHKNLEKKYFKKAHYKNLNPMQFDDLYWKKTIQDFANNILEIFDENKIILIKNFPATHFIDYSGCIRPYSSDVHFNEIALCHSLLGKLYSYFEECCPNCKVVDIPKYALGSQIHKWGNHPFHFTDLCYEYLLKCVKSITLHTSETDLANIFKSYSLLFKKQFDGALKSTSLLDYPPKKAFGLDDLLCNYEEFNLLGKKKKIGIYYVLDKQYFFKHIKKLFKKEK